MQITLTAAEIKINAAMAEVPENLMLWNDGAETWTLENLADELTDEALEGKGEDSEITLTAVGLSNAGCRAFVEGFCDAASRAYSYYADSMSGTPWCAPWHWADKADWFRADLTPYEMGKAWAEQNRVEIEEVFA